MTKRMLINAIDPEECRVVLADDDRLIELEVERADSSQLRGNIYKAAITRIEPSLQAAFLDIGSNRNGFLQINDIHPSYFRSSATDTAPPQRHRPAIQEVLSAGQNLVVQVVKDEREAKGATLTTNLSLPGRYLVLMVGNQRGGVSRKIADEGERRKLRQAVDKLIIPAGMGVIVRTAGINRNIVELQRDLDGLLELWYDIVERSFSEEIPRALYKESDLALRTLRDYFSEDIDEVLIDDKETYERACQFMTTMMPGFASRVIFYQEMRPLFSKFLLDKQVDATSHPEVTLRSGGSLVINVTEAVVTIDVNSGRSTGQSDVEETAYATNIEAAQEIARQLRLRDLGGLIVVDFIDMYDKRHRQQVERAFRDSIRTDKAKIELGRISKFGLLELSRQRLRASLVSQNHVACPHCHGRGRVKSAESAALEALRKIQSVAFAGGVQRVRVRMAPGAALFLLNNKRHALSRLEDETKITVLVYADGRMKPDEYELELDHENREGSIISEDSRSPAPRPSSGDRDSSRRSSGSGQGAGQGGGRFNNRDRNYNDRGRDRRRKDGRGRNRDRDRGGRNNNNNSSSNRERYGQSGSNSGQGWRRDSGDRPSSNTSRDSGPSPANSEVIREPVEAEPFEPVLLDKPIETSQE